MITTKFILWDNSYLSACSKVFYSAYNKCSRKERKKKSPWKLDRMLSFVFLKVKFYNEALEYKRAMESL